jgi:glutathione peroxidase-family protein
MNTNLSSVLGILSEVETARKEGCRRVCELLLLDTTSTIARILVENEQRLGAFDTTLLEKVAKTVEDHNIKRNITDWPFEHFWGNPYEPRHSKLLGYFVNPDEEHRCGAFLLGKLFVVLKESKILPNDEQFIADDCRVSQPEYIDLLIERDCENGKFAIIIENKINWAKDQWKQLQRYVESVINRGFGAKQIYVLYLPLTSYKNPDPNDLDTIKKLCVNYEKITFETHIRKWLEKAINEEPDLECPAAMHDGMRENLSHYLNLIKFLINKQKELKMNHELLKQLAEAEKRNRLPTWSQVESLQKSAVELKQCLESVLRGKLLLEIQRILQEQHVVVWLCLESEPTEKISVIDAYDERFGDSVDLCVHADANVSVCFGGNNDGFWLGYMRSGSSDNQKRVEPFILSEAQSCIKSSEGNDKTWYAWVWRKEITYGNCLANSSSIADKLVDMRNRLVDRLKKKDVGS